MLVVHEAKAVAIARGLVADDLGRLDGPDAEEHGAVLLVGEGLWQVVDDQVGGGLLSHALDRLLFHGLLQAAADTRCGTGCGRGCRRTALTSTAMASGKGKKTNTKKL